MRAGGVTIYTGLMLWLASVATPGSPPTASCPALIAAADKATTDREFDRAEDLYVDAIESAVDRTCALWAHHGLRNVCNQRRGNKSIELCASTALELAEALQVPSGDLRGMLMKLGRVYQDTGRYDDAETLYERALTSARADRLFESGVEGALLALGGLYAHSDRPAEAEQAYLSALRAAERVGGPDSIGATAAQYNLIQLYQYQLRCDQAAELLDRPVETLEDLDSEIDKVFVGLAACYEKIGRTEDGRAARARASQLEQRRLERSTDDEVPRAAPPRDCPSSPGVPLEMQFAYKETDGSGDDHLLYVARCPTNGVYWIYEYGRGWSLPTPGQRDAIDALWTRRLQPSDSPESETREPGGSLD